MRTKERLRGRGHHNSHVKVGQSKFHGNSVGHKGTLHMKSEIFRAAKRKGKFTYTF